MAGFNQGISLSTMMSGNEIMPVTLDDFEGEDRKSMEEYIKEITQEALMRACTRTRHGHFLSSLPIW
jgi:hypothetical protein